MGTALQLSQDTARCFYCLDCRASLCPILSALPCHPPDSTPCAPHTPRSGLSRGASSPPPAGLSGPPCPLAGLSGPPRPLAGLSGPPWPPGPTPRLTILPGPAAPQKRPQSFRLFLMMTSVTASNTNCTFLVSVAHVKCV